MQLTDSWCHINFNKVFTLYPNTLIFDLNLFISSNLITRKAKKAKSFLNVVFSLFTCWPQHTAFCVLDKHVSDITRLIFFLNYLGG